VGGFYVEEVSDLFWLRKITTDPAILADVSIEYPMITIQS